MDPFEERSKNIINETKYQDPFERRKAEKDLENDPFLLRSVEKNPGQFAKPVVEIANKVRERGFIGSFKRGAKSGVAGLISGNEPEKAPDDETFWEHLGALGGELTSDFPAMAVGGELGAIAGAPIGGPIGATGGAAIGSFALPTLIKESFKEYRDFAKQGEDLTFGEFLKRAGRVGKEGLKSGTVGLATQKAAKLLPILAKIPGADKILNSRIGKSVAEGALELGGLTGAQAALEGEAPTMEQLTDNLVALVGFKTARAFSSLGKKAASKITQKPTETVHDKSPFSDEYVPEKKLEEKKPDVKPLDIENQKELTKEEKLAQFEDIKENRKLTAKEQSQYDALVPDEKIKIGKTNEPIKATPKVDERSWVDIASNMLPESVRKKGRELGNKLLEKTPESIKEAAQGLGKLRQNARQKMYFEMLEDHIGKRNAKIMESQFKWREALEDAEHKGKFSKQDLEDMMYYRQKTGNPFKEGDSYQALEARLPKNAKEFVDRSVDTHLREMLKSWNENSATKDIHPREGLEDYYLPGLYEYDATKFAKAYDEVSKQFKTKNPFSNEKVFLNYLEAFQKAGLKPRYKNIVELMRAYDQTMLKTMANAELVKQIHDIEKNSKEKLIIRSTDEDAYNKAKALGYVPFDDVFLRRYVAGEKDGKSTWATTAAPALVHPDFASAFQGVFRKDAHKPESAFWKSYDNIANFIRFTRVSLSPFHYGALMEHAVGALGPEAFAIKKWTKQANELKKDKAFMMDAADSGLKVHEHIEQKAYEKGQSLIDKAIEQIPEKVGKIDISKGLDKLKKGLNYLFENFHPNLKLVTWKNFTDAEVGKLIKEGKAPSEAETKRIKRDMAKLVNDLYGGQNWETQRFLNNPTTMKWLRRAIAYPDWSVSSIKQAQNAFLPGIKGKVARRFWMKYALGYLTIQGVLKYMNSGWEQTDREGKSINGLKWNPEKAKNGLLDGDPTKWYMFPLPDFDVKIAGHIFNPGRDAQNKKLYAHFGKQALEIKHYIEHPFDELFAKSNPLIQIAYKQIMGHTPYEDTGFPVRGKYKNGKFEPWDATKPNTIARTASRAVALGEDVAPFVGRTFFEKGAAPFVASGLGAVPISKGISLYKAESYIEDAIRNNDVKKLNKITRLLKENSYDEKQIKRVITKVRNRIRKENHK